MCKDLLFSDLVFNKEGFSSLLEFERVRSGSGFVHLFLGFL